MEDGSLRSGVAERADIVVVGLGAAGLMAAIWAGRAARERGVGARIVGLDGAARLGAKILVAGGGRCNVTHHEVTERAYAGSSPHAIKKVLRSFGVERTVEFFGALGVEMKREETGKLFPVSDDAHTVLDALLGAAREAGVELRHPARVERVGRRAGGEGLFEIEGAWGALVADRVVMAPGGMALPRSGSDGFGYGLVRGLGHSVTDAVFPALVPLRVEAGHFLTGLSGLAAPAEVEVRAGSGKRLASFTGAVLCTHFGLSGPAILDVSRYLGDARRGDAGAGLVINWLPECTGGALDGALLEGGKARVARVIAGQPGGEGLPARLIEALCAHAGASPELACHALTREQRRRLVEAVCGLRVPVTGDRGFTFAEVTAGGLPLSEIQLGTMESRVCPGVHVCGEICDVDGRIGGFNFQWAWASGYLAGVAAGSAVGGTVCDP